MQRKPINIHIILSIYFYDIFLKFGIILYEFSSDAQSCPTSCDTVDCSAPALLVHHQHWDLAQTHVH